MKGKDRERKIRVRRGEDRVEGENTKWWEVGSFIVYTF